LNTARHTVAVTEPDPNPERLVMFTDAVAAIAITLLILPLLETISEVSGEGSVGDLVRENRLAFGAFALSFAVIFRFWWAHHRLFRHISILRPGLVGLSALWTFAIVFMPIPTAIVMAYSPSAGTVALYGASIVAVSGSLSAISFYARRHPEVSAGRSPETRREFVVHLTACGAQVVATVVGALLADTVNYWAFLLMFLIGPVERWIGSRGLGRPTEPAEL
jgi:uncharacterized membrane protein